MLIITQINVNSLIDIIFNAPFQRVGEPACLRVYTPVCLSVSLWLNVVVVTTTTVKDNVSVDCGTFC